METRPAAPWGSRVEGSCYGYRSSRRRACEEGLSLAVSWHQLKRHIRPECWISTRFTWCRYLWCILPFAATRKCERLCPAYPPQRRGKSTRVFGGLAVVAGVRPGADRTRKNGQIRGLGGPFLTVVSPFISRGYALGQV